MPPRRALVLQTLRKFRGETPPEENVQNLAWGIAIKGLPMLYLRMELAPKRPGVRRVARSRKKNYIPTKLLIGEKAKRTASLDSGRDAVLPFHNPRRASLEGRHSEDC